MRMLKTFLVAVTFLLLSGPLSAHANIIYNWTGTCVTLCVGQATMLVVTTDAYIPGEVFVRPFRFTTPVLLEALYADGNAIIDFAARFNTLNGVAFMLPASPSEGGFFQIEASDFSSPNSTGGWNAGGEEVFPNCDRTHNPLCGYIARGVDGVWTRLQTSMLAPSTLVLLGVGLAGLVFYRRRWLG
jgi:hypothetical protein